MHSLTFRPRVAVFDANIRVGDRQDEPAPCRDRAALLAEMDRHGIFFNARFAADAPDLPADMPGGDAWLLA